MENKIVGGVNVEFPQEDPVDFEVSFKIALEIGGETR